MGFTTPCFIRKNTPELQEKLKNIGYLSLDNDNDKRDGLVADRNGFMYSIFEKNVLGSTYNCGTNEELFLAIAALRNDTNYMQWFVCTSDYKESDGKEWKVGDFDLNTCPDDFNNILPHWSKATVNELIEHFKEKE
jgi:hypothetical protein